MQLNKKMNFFFQLCKWIKREKQMQFFIVKFVDKHISRVGKLERAYRGRSTSFMEMSSKKFDSHRSTRAEHKQVAFPTRLRRLQHALITRFNSLQVALKRAVNFLKICKLASVSFVQLACSDCLKTKRSKVAFFFLSCFICIT